MRRLLAATAIAAALLAHGPAASAADACDDEFLRVAVEHPRAWRLAGNPRVACGATPATQRVETGGYFDLATNTIYVRDGLHGYRRIIAHELGHAFFYRLTSPRRLRNYALIRGLDPNDVMTILEDHAETFALVLGEWADIATPPPYGFQTSAGLPTERQIARLRLGGLLPPR